MNKFKNASGTHFLKALFFETATGPEDRAYALYTLKNDNHTFEGRDYRSIREIYLECNDPTEYTIATKYFDGWIHWKKIIQCNWFKQTLEDCREELSAKMLYDALLEVRGISKDSNHKSYYMANKFLIDGEYLKSQDRRGRPSKERIQAEADKLFRVNEEINDDYSRLVSLADR